VSTKKKIIKTALLIIFYFIVIILFMAGAIIFFLTDWFDKTFGVDISSIIYTIISPLSGADSDFMGDAVRYCIRPFIKFGMVITGILAVDVILLRRTKIHIPVRIKKLRFSLNFNYLYRIAVVCLTGIMLFISLRHANLVLDISGYIKSLSEETKIYETYYVDPDDVEITLAAETQKNIIYIYVESMETTYASVDDGGAQKTYNYMPNLTELANEYINFSNDEDLGGWHSCTGTGWTMGSLFATTSGLPFAYPVQGNTMDKREYFAKDVTNLGDILADLGYYNEFLCGSDATFAGRRKYFTQHGNYDIFDYYTAIEEGYIAEDYRVWWGYQDSILFEIAKDELLELAALDQPFNFTMLTADTHHVAGYVCDLCGNEYSDQTANVVACTDNQVYEFVQWIMKQDFFEDTVIIITGDHPRMDTCLVASVEYYDRTVYNCIINSFSPYGTDISTTNREFMAMDMFPTILSAMGYEIEGDRLGLGTNLYSGLETLCEQLGYDYLNEEYGKSSTYYNTHFS